jgi:hypothetical protein
MATARYLNRTPKGGTLALEGDPRESMTQAQRLMAAQCGGRYTIVDQGEKLIGTETERRDGSKLSFVCDGPGGPSPAAAGAPPDAGPAPDPDARVP